MRKFLYLLFGVIFVVMLLELWIYFQIQRTSDISLQPNLSSREFTLATPKAQTTPSLPQSSINKWSAIPIKTKGTLVWQDGMFLYKTTDSGRKNVAPYALVGAVKSIDGQEFEIVSDETQVRVRLDERYGEVAKIRESKGSIVFSQNISYKDIKSGDKVEVYSLKPISENYFSTDQIFVILPE